MWICGRVWAGWPIGSTCPWLSLSPPHRLITEEWRRYNPIDESYLFNLYLQYAPYLTSNLKYSIFQKGNQNVFLHSFQKIKTFSASLSKETFSFHFFIFVLIPQHYGLISVNFSSNGKFGGRSFAFGTFSNTLLKCSADAGPFRAELPLPVLDSHRAHRKVFQKCQYFFLF